MCGWEVVGLKILRWKGYKTRNFLGWEYFELYVFGLDFILAGKLWS